MTTAELLRKEIEGTPPHLLLEVYHFLRFLKATTRNERMDGLTSSHSALQTDWASPEEDEAWKSL